MKNATMNIENKSKLSREDFQTTVEGKPVDLYILTNDQGMEVAITNYGCMILSIMVPDKNKNYENIVLGHSSIEDILKCPEPFLNTVVGRYANRIAKGKFTLEGKPYSLTVNNGPNALHGGPTGFHTRVWNTKQENKNTLVLTYSSKDGEEGYPGNLEVELTYTLDNESNALHLNYQATTDKTTIVNLTSHGFFNLAGIANPTPSIEDHVVTINADHYVPINQVSIPTGELLSVKDTPMDFLTPHSVAERINDDFVQLKNGAGYDHCYILNKVEPGELTLAATCQDPKSGRLMEVYTTELGVQLYTGNWLAGIKGAHGATFPARSAICFEAQCFPDTPNRTYFPSAKLEPGEKYTQHTVYKFK